MYQGQYAIDYLISRVNIEDPAASSHWQKYHSNFEVNNGLVKGIEGFGSNEISYKGLGKLFHLFFQTRYRIWALKSFKRLLIFFKFDYINSVILKKQNKGYSLDCLRQTLSLSFLLEKVPSAFSNKSSILVIGDGFASMTNLLWSTKSANTIILINLTKTLLVDLLHIKKILNSIDFNNNVFLISENEKLNDIENLISNSNKKILLIEAKNHIFLDYLSFNLVINIVSMQEMNIEVIKEYFDHIQKKENIYFYCCNRKEKLLPDGTVTRINEYPWRSNDKIIVDQLCPWHQEYYSFSRPFYRKYDGPIIHQLRIMNQTN
jgi:hypothetical protein